MATVSLWTPTPYWTIAFSVFRGYSESTIYFAPTISTDCSNFNRPSWCIYSKLDCEAVYVFDKVHIVVLADIELRGSKSTKAVKGPMKIMALDKQEWRRSARAHQTRLSHQDQCDGQRGHPSTVTCPHLRGNGGHNFTRSLLPLALTFALRQHSKCHPKLYPQLPRDDPPVFSRRPRKVLPRSPSPMSPPWYPRVEVATIPRNLN